MSKTKNEWDVQSLMDELENREPFSYDPESDLLYQQYREQYQKLGRQAMEDTVGQAAGLTGGYGSTYGETAGSEAYNAYLGKLNEVLPSLYDRKQAAYDSQTKALYNKLSIATEQESNAFDRCMELLGKGIRPSDEDLAAAGMTSDMASTALAIFQFQTGYYPGGSGTNAGAGSSGGSYRSSGGSGGGNNGGLSAAQVKELQQWLGVTADGQYGSGTQAAAAAKFGKSGLSAIQAWIAYQKAIGAYGKHDEQPVNPITGAVMIPQ